MNTAPKLACPTCGEDRKPRAGSSWNPGELWCPRCSGRLSTAARIRRREEKTEAPAPERETPAARGHRFNAQLACGRCSVSLLDHQRNPRDCPKDADL